MIVGSTDTGKSTLARILCNLALRSGYQPILADVDVGQSVISLPGTIGATPIEYPIGEDDLSASTSAASPLCFFFGHSSPGSNVPFYKKLSSRLAQVVDRRLARTDSGSRPAGVILNTCGWVEGVGYDILKTLIGQFSIDVVVVMDNERLANTLRKETLPHDVAVAQLQKSGGVVTRSSDTRGKARDRRIRQYFYGRRGELRPKMRSIPRGNLPLYSTKPAALAPQTAMPVGEAHDAGASETERLGVATVAWSSDMAGSVLALSYALVSRVVRIRGSADRLLEDRCFIFCIPILIRVLFPRLLCVLVPPPLDTRGHCERVRLLLRSRQVRRARQ